MTPPTPAPLAARLRAAGYTHLFVGYSELERLHATYGFDEAVTPDRLQHLTRGWPVVYAAGPAVLYRVPPRSGRRASVPGFPCRRTPGRWRVTRYATE